ncbi:MAG: DUF547 domain-containing protein [Pseudomonadota bacterium]
MSVCPSRRSMLGILCAGVALGASPLRVAEALAAPSSKLLDPKWQATGSGGDPDYSPWADFLATWLRPQDGGVTLVDYAGAKAAGASTPLDEWLLAMQNVDPTALSAEAAMAWWVNLYNAATIKLVLDHYPTKSILRIKGGLFNTGPWDEPVVTVNGDALTLNNVEHGILRPIWRDPRIHYAVNCASIGCPDLMAKPWTSATLDADLDAGARRYVNHPRGARVDSGQLIVSKIYTWFEEDFGGSSGGIIAHLRSYAEGDLAGQLAGIGRISNSEYDWDLNGA